ncbi:hypothetical protein ACFWD7_54485 [Streptomyces mirabilis]|uniref:hypothetical protein n=1 Tax=Streptomyces mirabilis TaxID=68239 RepID=UPI003692215B
MSHVEAGYPERQLDDAVKKLRSGQGASALVSAENGLQAWLERFEDDAPFTVDMARALSQHAEVLHRWGDPDLAVAAADLAIRTFLNRRDEINRTASARGRYVPAFMKAGLIAADIHQRFGRSSIAASARGLVQDARPMVSSLKIEAPVPLLADMTLARALKQVTPAGDERAAELSREFARAVTAPATDCSLVTSSLRCTSADAPMVAGMFAAAATATSDREPAASLRLGLEAHVLYAHQSERQTPELRYNMGEHGPSWARVLLACSQICAHHGLRALTLDLASWMAGTVAALTPFAVIDLETRSVAHTCISWHAELMTATGDTAGAADAREALRNLDAMP